ncbi:MAG TPA: carboxypeptidase-like regulatory domain-containing protein [Planctomycetota bacterium]|nr:carboxypeptidase-like regulatory domain-containing protein [Planctomycetota bacterium]
MPRILTALVLLLPLAAGCDNVGRAFNPGFDPNNTPTTGNGPSPIQVVPTGGDTKDGRPKVRATFPSGSGWPTTVPIVVEFTESINEESILPTATAGNDAKVILRVKGTTQALPCQYDFLGEGRLLVLRPVTALSNQGTPFYEIVLLPDGRDTDGVRFQVPTGGTVLAEFQVNQDESMHDGRVLMTFPRDNATDVAREATYYVVFDRPANAATITESSFKVQPRGGSPLPGTYEYPLSVVGIDDPRLVRFRPMDLLAGTVDHELVVDSTITFGADGQLDFRGRTPFAVFRTVGPAPPTGVTLGNPAPGFDDKINRSNAANPVLHVTTPLDTLPGDRVRARIYGGDAKTAATNDLAFVERFADATMAGAQTVVVDFSGVLGTLNSPKFDDGAIHYAVQMRRGSQSSGFVINDASQNPIFDITPPTLMHAGPPVAADGTTLLVDQEAVAFYGTASERIGAATLTAGSGTVELFASSADGQFLMGRLPLGRLSAPLPYMLVLTDRAGNVAAGQALGNIVQRGYCTGLVTMGQQLTVEAYDRTTLLPVAGATVLVDPGAPALPASGQQVGTTDANGRVTFASLTGSDYTVTIVRMGFDLVTLYRTRSAFVSLPLRPVTGSTATLQGTVSFLQTAGTTALVSSSAVADHSVLGVRTANASPMMIPDTLVAPNRPQVLTAFAGTFEPTDLPAFTFQGFQMLGRTGLAPAPPPAPAAPGQASSVTIEMAPAVGSTPLLGALTEDFALAVGLDLGNLVGGKPRVRVVMGLDGFENQVLAGVGVASAQMAGAFSLTATFHPAAFVGLAAFFPRAWTLAEAEDTAGRVSRSRALLDPTTSGVVPGTRPGPLPIPTIMAPAGPATGSPAVTFQDGLDPLLLPGLLVGSFDLTAEAAGGRRWLVLGADRDGAGGTDTVQFPDLATANVAGLPPGTWTLKVEARIAFAVQSDGSSDSADDFVWAERFHNEASYSRSAPVQFTVQ